VAAHANRLGRGIGTQQKRRAAAARGKARKVAKAARGKGDEAKCQAQIRASEESRTESETDIRLLGLGKGVFARTGARGAQRRGAHTRRPQGAPAR
jgi:hypothetical protein